MKLPTWAKYLFMVHEERDTLTAGNPPQSSKEFLEETPSPKRLRSSTARPFHWKTGCLFCAKEAIIDRKHPERDIIMYVRTLSIRNTLSFFRKRLPIHRSKPIHRSIYHNLPIIELAMWLARMYVSHVLDRELLERLITKIAGYVRARILMNR